MVKVTFMGTGAALDTNQRTNIALLVQENDASLVIECGPTILYQLHRAGSAVDQVNNLFISHRHGDHILGLPMFLLMHSLDGVSGPLSIFGNEDVIRTAQELTRLVYPELDEWLKGVTWVSMPKDHSRSVELAPSMVLSTFPLPHSPHAPVLALRLDLKKSGRSLVYTGDTSYNKKSQGFIDFAAGCDLLVHEANFSQTLEPDIKASFYGHSTALRAGQTAAQAKARILALVHLSPKYEGKENKVRAEAAQVFDGQVTVPQDCSTFYL